MKRTVSLLIATGIAAGFAVAANAKTLVYCSEGSPEGFDPALYTTGTTMDASSQAVYNRLVEFVKGTTQVGPGLGFSYAAASGSTRPRISRRPATSTPTT
jgi:dipeptide transport system substrate-binding protein